MNLRRSIPCCTNRAVLALFASACAVGGLARVSSAQQRPITAILKDISFDQRLGQQVPLDAEFLDENGARVKLGQFFGEKPVVLTLVYYQCPMLCTQVLNGLVRSLRTLSLTPGKDFEIVTISINPKEAPGIATEKKAHYLEQYQRENAGVGWHFLTPLPAADASPVLAADGEIVSPGSQNIHRVAEAVGFRYAYDKEIAQYAHASGLVTLTPEGKVSKYYFGVEYDSNSLRLALVESSEGKIGTLVDRLLMLCYHYDPTTGKYGLAIMSVIRLVGGATVVLLLGFVFTMLRRERRATRLLAGGV